MQIHQIRVGKKVEKKRIGRGGKKGTYSGKGMKGQKSRKGFSSRATFEGGSTSIVARTKKLRGFRSVNESNQVINLEKIDSKFESNGLVNPENLKKKGLIKNASGKVKILSEGSIEKKLVFEGVSFSKEALKKIEKAGGEIKKIK